MFKKLTALGLTILMLLSAAACTNANDNAATRDEIKATEKATEAPTQYEPVRTKETVNKQGEDIEVSIKGRHDPMIVPRAVVVVEAMTALTLVDLIFDNMTARMDRVKEFYRK